MRVMVIVKATKSSESGSSPERGAPDEMGRYNEALVEAGVMLAGEGLQPSSQGKRVAFSAASGPVIDGPFAATKELVAGFWIWQVKSMDEALEWAKRCPDPMPGERARARDPAGRTRRPTSATRSRRRHASATSGCARSSKSRRRAALRRGRQLREHEQREHARRCTRSIRRRSGSCALALLPRCGDEARTRERQRASGPPDAAEQQSQPEHVERDPERVRDRARPRRRQRDARAEPARRRRARRRPASAVTCAERPMRGLRRNGMAAPPSRPKRKSRTPV